MPAPSESIPREGFLLRAAALPVLPANLAGALLVYLYFTFVDPLDPTIGHAELTLPEAPEVGVQRFIVFTVVVSVLLAGNVYLSARWFGPLARWRQRLREGADPATVPLVVRRRVLNAPLANTLLTQAAWMLAGTFYLVYLRAVAGLAPGELWRITAALVLVAGPLTAALTFLASEFYLRRQVPVFFPDGRIERRGVLRVPILARLGGTFAVTSILPLALMLLVDFGIQRRYGPHLTGEISHFWHQLVRAQAFIAIVTGVVSLLMAWLVARFINRPVQALRAAMAAVATGDLSVRAPVRSADELGELNAHFNAMVDDLRTAERTRELFGRYVSPAVAQHALERGIAFRGETVHATAMFVDLRGFTAMTRRGTPEWVVQVLTEYYAIVERVCEREGGVVTQFLGDGVIVVFGGPLQPLRDHARAAVRAAIELQRALAQRNLNADERLDAGIGIATGDMIAGNVGTGRRVTYTIVGDAVNLAARLQVMTRDLASPILVTESTREALGDGDGLELRPFGRLPLKGIAEPVAAYGVMA